jgi:aminopeptidase N
VLASLWDMTRDAEMGARHFVDVVLETLPGESDSTLLRTLIAQLQTAVHAYTAPQHRDAVRAATRDRLWQIARTAEPGSDAQLQLVSAAAALTTVGDDTTHLRALLDGTETLEGLTVDFEMRWTLLTALVAAGDAGADEIDAEQAREDTATGRERAARARAARPTPEAKEEAWAVAAEGTGLPNAVVEETALGFTRPGTPPELLRPFVERYHALLDTIEQRGSHAVIETIVFGFYPRPLADAALRDRTQAWLDANPQAPAALRRLVVENRDPVVRALAAQERDARG